MLSFCKKYKVPVIVDSDAHIFYDIGNLDRAKEMLEACEFPKKLILNTKLKGLSYVLNLEREEIRTANGFFIVVLPLMIICGSVFIMVTL